MPRPASRFLLIFGFFTLVSAVHPQTPTISAESPSPVRTDAPVALAEVVVTPSRFGVADQPENANATLTSAELEAMPQLGEDFYRTLARLPGLAADDFTAQFWVRGAPNNQVLARLADGVELIEPFHLKDVDGALSIVDLQTINRVDLLTGGFTANYGDRLAGVLSMETKSGAALNPATTLDLSLTGLSGTNQGVFAEGRGRWQLAARRGYPDVALRVDHEDNQVDPRYYDLTGKVEFALNDENTVSFHVLHAYDALTYHESGDPNLSSRYLSDYVWGRWQGSISDRLTGEAVLSFSQLTTQRYGYGQFDGFPFSLQDNRRLDLFGLRQDWTLTLAPRALLRAGLDLGRGDGLYNYGLIHALSVVTNGKLVAQTDTLSAALRPDGDTLGAYVAPRFQPWIPLIIEPSLRFDRHDATHDSDWSARLNGALTLGTLTVRAAWGVYYQSEGLQEIAVQDGETSLHPAERAEHRILSFEHPLAAGIDVRVEAYERLTSSVRPRWDNVVNPYEVFPEVQSDVVRLAPSRERARGVEVLVEHHAGKQFDWAASYARASSEEFIDGGWIPVARDQRDTLHADLTFTPSRRWQFSGSWQYHTGWPTTNVVYFYAPLANGQRQLEQGFGPIYGVRLPDYHRLDLRATRRFHIGRGQVRIYVDVFNAYDRQNIVGYDYSSLAQGSSVATTEKPRKLLPILPSACVEWSF